MPLVKFQFQTGAIKSRDAANAIGAVLPEFQFQTGAIKSRACYREPQARQSRFNSKLVRLKASGLRRLIFNVLFQFQTGAIKSVNELSNYVGNFRGFNSKLVRLKEENPVPEGTRSAKVSIPNWCD